MADNEVSLPLRVAIIGTGRPHRTEDSTGFGMSHAHAKGYNESGKCEIVALCDLVAERARLFNDEHAGGKATVYTDYPQMLAEVKPDIVSICTWPALHTPMVVACAEAGVRAIHCEKPMATTWDDAQKAANACIEHGVQLTYNHQRRFNGPFQSVRRLINQGEIGDIVRMEGACGDMYDWGTHWLNMFLFYNNETPAEWVLAQTDARRSNVIFGVQMETQGITVIKFKNGVYGTLYTGTDAQAIVGCANRIIGKEGTIEVLWEKPWVRYRKDGDWQTLPEADVQDGIHGGNANTMTVGDVVDSVIEGRKPLQSVDNALPTTEIIFAAYESARRRGRVDLPLTAGDNAFHALVADGIYPEAV